VVLGLSNGQALVFHHTYKITYPDNKKTITASIDYPYGEAPSCWTSRAVRWST
jgi:phosphate transport system permease protein